MPREKKENTPELFDDNSGWREWSRYVLGSLKDLDETDEHIYKLFEDFRGTVDTKFVKTESDHKEDNSSLLKLIGENTVDVKSLNTKVNILISIFAFLASAMLSLCFLLLKVYLDKLFLTG